MPPTDDRRNRGTRSLRLIERNNDSNKNYNINKNNNNILLLDRWSGARNWFALNGWLANRCWWRRPPMCVYKQRSPGKFGTLHMWQLYVKRRASFRYGLREKIWPLLPSLSLTFKLSKVCSTSNSTCKKKFRSNEQKHTQFYKSVSILHCCLFRPQSQRVNCDENKIK